jgi:hypothetical protein
MRHWRCNQDLCGSEDRITSTQLLSLLLLLLLLLWSSDFFQKLGAAGPAAFGENTFWKMTPLPPHPSPLPPPPYRASPFEWRAWIGMCGVMVWDKEDAKLRLRATKAIKKEKKQTRDLLEGSHILSTSPHVLTTHTPNLKNE